MSNKLSTFGVGIIGIGIILAFLAIVLYLITHPMIVVIIIGIALLAYPVGLIIGKYTARR